MCTYSFFAHATKRSRWNQTPTMARFAAPMAAIFSLFSRIGAFAFVSPLGNTGSLTSHNNKNAAGLPAQLNRRGRVRSHRPRMVGEAFTEKKAVFGGGCFW